MNLMDPSTLALAGSLAGIGVAVAMSAATATFQIRAKRMPDATAYEDIRERRIREELRLSEMRAELSIVEQKIQDRDRLIAEVSSLEERLTSTKLEYESLGSARNEIDETKQKAAEAAEEYAVKRQECDAVIAEIAKKKDEFQELEARCNPERIAQLEEQLSALRTEKSTLEAEMPSLRAERDAALGRIEDARSADTRKAALELEVERLEEELDRLSEEYDQRARKVRDIRDVDERHSRLSGEIAGLEARRALLEAEIARGEKERVGESEEGISGDFASDLSVLPACLSAPDRASLKLLPEHEAVGNVRSYLKEHGLDYSFRTVRAFHTCLKINDNAQITVLAGVSGTGKSLLPRRYAEAMGIHFHQIAVEPRWDSPQDLLGFYNYIEKKYRATDLARLLAYMDPYRTANFKEISDERRNHVALVLLDEMNLARVEYYFSEFLSRLEVRPRYEQETSAEQRRPGLIPIDIRGQKQPIALYPSHNVLFAGTMNDDESTQSLSDKVLDRGNILQFAAPKQFDNTIARDGPAPTEEALSFKAWRGWVRDLSSLKEGRGKADQVISKLADLMEGFGRPFGHRLRDSILVYAANYPRELNGTRDVTVPLADQIEFRILPKLRGLEIEAHREGFDRLIALARAELGDQQLADRLTELLDRQGRGAGLFVWRGLTRTSS